MKAFNLICILGLVAGIVSARADDTKTNIPAAAATPVKTASTDEVAVIKTTEGTMVVEFWPDAAPKTVANFKSLAEKGFYDGTCFHRVIKGFMIQGGDPLTKDPSKEDMWGTGGPGYSIKAEFNDHSHHRGVISMARSSDPDSAGSQFLSVIAIQLKPTRPVANQHFLITNTRRSANSSRETTFWKKLPPRLHIRRIVPTNALIS